jgi:hypothetical protein
MRISQTLNFVGYNTLQLLCEDPLPISLEIVSTRMFLGCAMGCAETVFTTAL